VLVYNLKDYPLTYRDRVIPPNGGYHNFPELDDFVPDRDKKLAENKVIGLGSLPKWWIASQKAKEAERRESVAAFKAKQNVPVATEVKVDDTTDMSAKLIERHDKFQKRK
jgi:hypothetical protein